MKKVMILGVPTSGKTSILKLLDGDIKFNVAHTDDKVLDFFVNFDLKKMEKKMNKFESIYSDYADSKQITKLKINKDTTINYSVPLHLYIVNTYLSCHNLETWSKLKCLPSEHSSKIRGNENFDFDYHKFENIFYDSIFKKRELNSEQYLELYYDAYFSSWNNELNNNDKELLIFQGPNDYRSAEYVLKENFDIKIIYIKRDDYSRIISNSFRIKKVLKDRIYSNIVISDIANDYSKKRRILLEKAINNLSLLFKKQIFTTSFDKIIFETKLEIKKISDWLEVKFKDLMYKPSFAGQLVNQNYINRSLDIENFNNDYKELNVLLSFYCKKITVLEFLKNLNLVLLKLFISYLFLKLTKFIRFKNIIRTLKKVR